MKEILLKSQVISRLIKTFTNKSPSKFSDFSAFMAFNLGRKRKRGNREDEFNKSGCDDIKIIIFLASSFYDVEKEKQREKEELFYYFCNERF
jgi:hypothetical protein